jgi:5-oxoprolinase (ATP-hydrolysing)
VREDGHHGGHQCAAGAQGRAHAAGHHTRLSRCLRIAYQNRPRIFDRNIQLPELLYSAVVEAQERVGAHGEVVQPLDEAAIKTGAAGRNTTGAAQRFDCLHARLPLHRHEQAAARMAREVGFTQVSTSHETSPMMKFVSRGDTTVVDAYLSPILRRYVEQVAGEMPGSSCSSCSPVVA